MPQNGTPPSLTDPELSEELRTDGRTAVGRRGGASGSYEDGTVVELRARAKQLGIRAYSGGRTAELIDMFRDS
ncbi:hypothetical protein DEU37_1438 [Microbacterium sp. AG790]|uniref:Rho termination factor n=1 Tax=Microbacterium sp. AG790 TaxID=2183995 RepID=UPI000EB04D3C|nr:Rho termination factor [Microbacterium sp. AG790]RKS90118.1 hypothetical protein DEU37_1438 [Microbacterium sp. AG790]